MTDFDRLASAFEACGVDFTRLVIDESVVNAIARGHRPPKGARQCLMLGTMLLVFDESGTYTGRLVEWPFADPKEQWTFHRRQHPPRTSTPATGSEPAS